MKEILGGNLDLAFEELGIDAIKTYEGNTNLDKNSQVWELRDEDFGEFCNISDNDWKREWGWWRSAEGSNMRNPLETFKIKGQEIIAWDGANRLEADKADDEDDRYLFEREYYNLLEYMCDEMGASQPRNVCALATDLARINNIKMGELFQKYQGCYCN